MPCLSDGDAHLALDPKDPFRLQTKPHGHGDVHALLVGGLQMPAQQTAEALTNLTFTLCAAAILLNVSALVSNSPHAHHGSAAYQRPGCRVGGAGRAVAVLLPGHQWPRVSCAAGSPGCALQAHVVT